MNALPVGVQRPRVTAFHSPRDVKGQNFHRWGLFCEATALAVQSEGLASLAVAFNAVIEHLLCAPLDPSLWQCFGQSH